MRAGGIALSKEQSLRTYEIELDQFPGVVIVMEYDESKRRSPALQTSYGQPGEDIPQLVMRCPGKIKVVRFNKPHSTPLEVVQAFSLLASEGVLYHKPPEPPPPPKPTPEPYEQERF